MDIVRLNGKTFPVREFIVRLNGEQMQIAVAQEKLENELNLENEAHVEIDDDIYFYVGDKAIFEKPETICAFYLDEPMVFVEEVNPNPTVLNRLNDMGEYVKAKVSITVDIESLKNAWAETNDIEDFDINEAIWQELGWTSSSGISTDDLEIIEII